MIEFKPKNYYEDADYDACGNTTIASLIVNGIRIPLCEHCVKELTDELREFNNTIFCHKCDSFTMNNSGWNYGGRCSCHNKDVDCMGTCDDAFGAKFMPDLNIVYHEKISIIRDMENYLNHLKNETTKMMNKGDLVENEKN